MFEITSFIQFILSCSQIMRLEQRLERMQSTDQSTDLDHYVKKMERHNEALEKQKAALAEELDLAR